jgi:hypothetical protein
MPYAGKSLMIHIYHKLFNSTIKGLRKTSSFFPGFFGPGIIIGKNMNGLVMHFHGGKL